MRFIVEHQRHGTQMQKFTVPAKAAGLVGRYVRAVPYRPDTENAARIMSHQYRKAVLRGQWYMDELCSDLMRMDLTSLKGAPMGTLIAKRDF